jgi:hypothetical protein
LAAYPRRLGGDVGESADHDLTREAQPALNVPPLLPKPHDLGCCIGCLSKIYQKVVDASGHRSNRYKSGTSRNR